MLLTYTPEDGERQQWTFKPRKALSVESELLEECGGASWSDYDEFGVRLVAGNLKARRALLWVMLKREQPKLRFVDVVVKVDELDIDYDAEEKVQVRERIEADKSLTDEERVEALALIDDSVAAEVEPEGKGGAGGDGTGSL